jgi:hypothetical protein
MNRKFHQDESKLFNNEEKIPLDEAAEKFGRFPRSIDKNIKEITTILREDNTVAIFVKTLYRTTGYPKTYRGYPVFVEKVGN